MSLADHVVVNISTTPQNPSAQGFGVPLIMGYHNNWIERHRLYTSLQGLLDDGFLVTDAIYLMAEKIFTQPITPPTVAVGRMAFQSVQSINLTPDAQNEVSYNVEVNGLTATFVSDATALVAEITAGLKLAIDALAVPGVTTTDNTTDLDIDATAGTRLAVSVNRNLLARVDNTPDPGYAADLAAIRESYDDWYSLLIVDASKAIIVAVSALIEAIRRTFYAECGDDNIHDSLVTTDVATTLQGLSRKNTILTLRKNPHLYFSGALAGDIMPQIVGTWTAKFESPASALVDDWTATEIANTKAKGCNVFLDDSGYQFFQEGVTPGGQFFDDTVLAHWLQANMETAVANVFANSPKTAYTDAGIRSIGAAFGSILDTQISRGGIAADPAPQIILPLAADISAANRTARLLPGLSWSAQTSGAIHKAAPITGNLT